jgi:hypothetical protein
MDIFSLGTPKNFSEFTRTLTTVSQRLLRRFAADPLEYILYPIACIGYVYWTIRRRVVGPPLVLKGQPLNVRADLQFYEADRGGTRQVVRKYEYIFPDESTRFVMCEVTVRKLCSQPDRLYKLVLCYHKPDGSLLWEHCHDWLIYSRDTRKGLTFAVGYDEPGHWTPGKYNVWLYLDGVYAVQAFFIIRSLPPPPPPPLPAEVLQQPSVQFYASETGRFQTESRRNSVRFPHQTTRWVICELTVRNQLYRWQDRTYHVIAQCYTAEGKLLWEDRCDWPITSQEQEPSLSWALQAGQWIVGAYRLEILIDGEDFAWGAFAIE